MKPTNVELTKVNGTPPASTNDASLGDKSVEQVQKPNSLTPSDLHELDNLAPQIPVVARETKVVGKTPKEQSSTQMAELLVEMKKLREAFNARISEQSDNIIRLEKTLGAEKLDLQKKVEILEGKQAIIEKEKAASLNQDLEEAQPKKNSALVLILNGIQSRMPGLLSAYAKMNSANTPKAKADFVAFYSSEIRSAFHNITNIKEDVDIAELKTSASEAVSRLKVFSDNEQNQIVLPFIEAALKQIQDPKAPLPPVSKLDKVYALLESFKWFAAVTTSYVLGNEQSSILALLPEAINNVISAIQEYAGAPTVPLLCFGIYYALYLIYELGVKAKNAKFPVAPEVQAERNKTEILNLFAKQAIVA